MIPLPDDDGMVTFPDQARDRAMGVMDQWASRLQHLQAASPNGRQGPFGSAVGGDDHIGSGDVGDLVLDMHSLRTKLLEDGLVLNQVAQNGDRLGWIQGRSE